MPEADDLTPSEHDRVARKRSFLASKKIRCVLKNTSRIENTLRIEVIRDVERNETWPGRA